MSEVIVNFDFLPLTDVQEEISNNQQQDSEVIPSTEDVDTNEQNSQEEPEKVSESNVENEDVENETDVDITPEITSTSNSAVFDILKNIGIDTYLEVEGEEEIEVELDPTKVTPELAVELIKSKYELEIEHLKENSVSIEDIDADRKAVIDMIAKGGDPTKLIEYQTKSAEISTYDLEDPEQAEIVIRKQFEMENKSKKEADIFIAGLKATDSLIEGAEEASEKITKFFEDKKAKEQETLEEAIKLHQERIKEYTKSFRDNTKELQVSDKLRSNLVDYATKLKKYSYDTPNGKVEIEKYPLDVAIENMRTDTKEAVELAFFVLHREEYKKKIAEEMKLEITKDVIKKTRTARVFKGSSSAPTTQFEKNQTSSPANFIPLT